MLVISSKINLKYAVLVFIFGVNLGVVQVYASEPALGKTALALEDAVSYALAHDPWIEGSLHAQDAVEAMSVAVAQLPDPKVSVGYANIPTDTFDFDQERMTQFKVGISQMFPRGDTLGLSNRQLQITAHQYPYLRLDRNAQVTVTVSALWLDAYKAQQTIFLVEQSKVLFEQLLDISQANYTSAIGRTRQQDMIRAQLELTRLDDRLTVFYQNREIALKKLSEWLGQSGSTTGVVPVLPDLQLSRPGFFSNLQSRDLQPVADLLMQHPAIQVLEKKITASAVEIELAKQKYKPEWGVNASYGYRDDDPMGNDRADLLSVGVTFDLPIFTANRQDQQVKAAVSRSEAVKTDKSLRLRQMMANLESAQVQLMRLDERQKLYRLQLLPQMQELAEASLTAYTNDDGDFAEVARARIAQLNAQIDALNIEVDRQKLIVQLNYFFVDEDHSLDSMLLDSAPSFSGETR